MSSPAQPSDPQAISLHDLLTPNARTIASRVLAKTAGGSVTLFSFAAGEGLDEHSSPHEALVVVLDGRMAISVAGRTADAGSGTLVTLPAHVPHAVAATDASLMLLVMLKSAPA